MSEGETQNVKMVTADRVDEEPIEAILKSYAAMCPENRSKFNFSLTSMDNPSMDLRMLVVPSAI